MPEAHPPTLIRSDKTWILDLGEGENNMSAAWIGHVHRALDRVEGGGGPHSLVSIGRGKYYCNGLDLSTSGAENLHGTEGLIVQLEPLLARLLVLPVTTVAAINGHAFGGGALFALAHDFRFMRRDRGYICLPEVDLGVIFTAGLASLVKEKLTAHTAMSMMTTGRRIDGISAKQMGIVDDIADIGELSASAVSWATSVGRKNPAVLAATKHALFATTHGLLAPEMRHNPVQAGLSE